MANDNPHPAVIDRDRLTALRMEEDRAFVARTPRSRALHARAVKCMPHGVPMPWMAGLWRTPPIYITAGTGPYFTDVDGNDYLDFNLCDLSMTIGYGHEGVARVVADQARRGPQFLLPTEDSIAVSEELCRRMRLPSWQYTLSASGANTEVIRIARFMTGRPKVVIFGGHYHGHIEETMVRDDNGTVVPETAGLSPGSANHTTILPFNDLDSLERTLSKRDVALVLTEPALTNCNVVLPQPGFLDGLRELTRRYGTLLCIDEAHTFQFAFGGLSRAWNLNTDFIVAGKGFGSGLPFGLYGMSEEVATSVARHADGDLGPRGIALGGTTYGSALALAVARVMLEEVMTEAAYQHVTALGAQLANGLDTTFRSRSLPWTAFRCGPRSGFCLEPKLPLTGADAYRSLDYDFIDARRVYFANRGVWDAVASAGPQVSLAHSGVHIETYVALAAEFIDRIRVR